MKTAKAKQVGGILVLLVEIAAVFIICSMRNPADLPWIQPDLFPYARSVALVLALILLGITGYWLDRKRVLADMPDKTIIVFRVLVLIVLCLFLIYG